MRLFEAVQECVVNSILLSGSNGWYNLRCLFTSLATVQIPAYIFLMTNTHADVALSVFALVMANKVGDEVNQFLWLYSQIESTMVKFERCKQFEQI